jgi:UDP-N-acetylmuramoyl-L-alanyl-D-glutamate--2,6-diaminopimelate ligase
VALAPSALAERLGGELRLAVVGAVHAENALAAALAADSLGYAAAAISGGLAGFGGVPGRFQIVATRPLVAVDYAHTPDGLERTLATGRQLVGAGGRLICVFGCGGERDQGKRPQMGAIAHAGADQVWLTNDNPRREAPAAIAAQIRGGAAGPGAHWEQELDRAAAITRALAGAGPADVIIIAGKGHEEVQEIDGRSLPFSDVDVARATLRR